MSKGIGILIVVAVVVIGAIMWATGIYNNLVGLDENVTQSWSQVENQYQRRADLIPNLVNTVKGVANFEKETYTAVTEARAKVNQINMSPEMLSDPNAFQQFQSAQDGLSSALSRLLVTVENYPQLKANENFSQLQAQLEGTENRISVERKKFNEVVQNYNTTIRQFPGSIIAGFTGFQQKQYFQAAAGSDQAPKVEF
ncbi:MAG: LemA family protein [Ignavibacteriae bacterium]|nr:LemA family protein [Flavobacteriales bacterium]MCB0730647.1 LemA family protein [Ignavibacteriota bacterium]MCB0751109.1 LemA family protein [Ignavibacteriota bacterium]MCB9210227.1 LemA family protein [Ignavibacteriales bacterium]MCB9259607.1 LemA family protein [Ignavibacteriales bacterium]